MQEYSQSSWRLRLHTIIFEADTRAGKVFDIALILSIILSVIVVLLDSIAAVNSKYGDTLLALEWFFTILFTIEYVLRIISVGSPLRYITSFFGVIDLLAILPTYLSVIFPGSQVLMVVRLLRVLRIFRVLKLAKFLGESVQLMRALKASRRKITVFLFFILTIVSIMGSVMYLVEGAENGFTSIPRSIYWAIVTLTTVGYGDISPQTPLGQTIAAIIMILGYAIIAVPTGIVTTEMGKSFKSVSTQACPNCSAEGHDADAVHCKYCGAKL
ncbi:MAG TPA: ion transporter [Caldithrix abyssi]|uniref:Ion transporter n=1 Tax=Caldithrix abyssi TaxID=187145 RepID=A0A7V4TZE7_CALAY|nr:ion transporter [Caldithrix abyssi]